MPNTIKYFAPSNFVCSKSEKILFDFTQHIRKILKNEVWKRGYFYGDNLKNINENDIEKCQVTIFASGVGDFCEPHEMSKILKEEFGKIPSPIRLSNRLESAKIRGGVLFEIEVNFEVPDIPVVNNPMQYSRDFIEGHSKGYSLIQEISALLLSGLNLLFPTNSLLMDSSDPISDGFMEIQSNGKGFFQDFPSSAFTHTIFINTDERQNIDFIFETLSDVWHYNLWSLRRYLIAVESSKVTMDNLLDLMYSLEGLFENNASTDFMKTLCAIEFSKTKKEAQELKSFLDKAFFLRNEMVHGGKTFDPISTLKIGSNTHHYQDIYWEMKKIVATLIVKAIFKLGKDKSMRSLRYTIDDIWDNIYSKKIRK